MPLIVDKDAVRRDILLAFERCMEKKPMPSVSLRDIAAEMLALRTDMPTEKLRDVF